MFQPTPVPHAWKPHGPSVGLGDGLGDGLSEGDGVVGVAVGVDDGAAVGVGVDVPGRAVGVVADPQAARLKAAIAAPITVVSFMSLSPIQRERVITGYVP